MGMMKRGWVGREEGGVMGMIGEGVGEERLKRRVCLAM